MLLKESVTFNENLFLTFAWESWVTLNQQQQHRDKQKFNWSYHQLSQSKLENILPNWSKQKDKIVTKHFSTLNKLQV
jgi:hypothetical protein